jgi:outer membrane lipoprotein SlyB
VFHGIPENYMDNDSKEGSTTQVATNLDPITGAPGAHPVGVGLGAAVGGIAAGAAAGTIAVGPLGTVVGAAVGAIAGGLGGKSVAEHFDPTVAEIRPEHDLRTTKFPLVE